MYTRWQDILEVEAHYSAILPLLKKYKMEEVNIEIDYINLFQSAYYQSLTNQTQINQKHSIYKNYFYDPQLPEPIRVNTLHN